MDHVHCWSETTYEGAVLIPIFFETLLSVLKESKDIIG